MIDLLDNFLDLIKLYLAVVSDFMKSLRGRMGGGNERKMNGRSATANQVKDPRKRLKQKLTQKESATKIILSKKLCAQ
jgi:hypothetical protein